MLARRASWRLALALRRTTTTRASWRRSGLAQATVVAVVARDLLFPARDFAKFSRRGIDEDDDDDDELGDPNAKPDPQKGPRLNRQITDRYIRLVTSDGHRVVTRQEALETAHKQGLDLVEVDPTNEPVVCKIMDYKLEKYREKMREKEKKKTNAAQLRLNEVKELQFSNKIDDRDLEMKADNASRLIQKGHRVKCVVKVLVKGSKADEEAKNDRSYRTDPRASQLVEKLIDLLKDVAKVEAGPQVERHRVWAMLRPIPPPDTKQKSPKGSKKEAAKTAEEAQEKEEAGDKSKRKEETKKQLKGLMKL